MIKINAVLSSYSIWMNKGITRADFMRLTGISRDKAIKLLKKYQEEGIIRRYGGGKTVVYLKA